MNGSTIEKLMMRVFRSRNGSRYAVSRSGTSFMSDSWMAWNPRIEEPSKSCPVAMASSSKVLAGMLKCCMMPGRSQKRMSMNSTPSSSMYFATSLGLLNTSPPSAPCGALSAVSPRGAEPLECRGTASGPDSGETKLRGSGAPRPGSPAIPSTAA